MKIVHKVKLKGLRAKYSLRYCAFYPEATMNQALDSGDLRATLIQPVPPMTYVMEWESAMS